MAFLPENMRKLPVELKVMIIMLLPDECFINFIYTFFVESELCFMLIGEKMKEIMREWPETKKAKKESQVFVVSLMKIGMYMIHNKVVSVDSMDFLDEDGTCYLSEISSFALLMSCKYLVGTYPSPWLVECLYSADEGYGLLTKCRQKICAIRQVTGRITYYCVRCQINGWFNTNVHASHKRRVERLLFRHIPGSLDLHLCGFHDQHTMNYKSEVAYRERFGDGDYLTMFILRQKDIWYCGKVGTPVVVDFGSEVSHVPKAQVRQNVKEVENLNGKQRDQFMMAPHSYFSDMTPTPLNCRQKTFKDSPYLSDKEIKTQNGEHRAQSTVMPNDSASNITPTPLNCGPKPVNRLDLAEVGSMISSMLDTKIANFKTDIENLARKETGLIGDYTRFEYDHDLQEAFQSSGVIYKDGQMFLKPMAYTRACDLIPKVTIDDRLNFLIRLHTAIFKLVPNTPDYPKPGIMHELRSATDGDLPDDHPSYDLLQIVLTDTIDWNHLMIKSNNFLLPVLEQGMRFNERILASCLLSLKGEYFARWTSVMKDCILPTDITDTSRWSDSYSTKVSRMITAKRPDLAIHHRQSGRKGYSRRRRDSALG